MKTAKNTPSRRKTAALARELRAVETPSLTRRERSRAIRANLAAFRKSLPPSRPLRKNDHVEVYDDSLSRWTGGWTIQRINRKGGKISVDRRREYTDRGSVAEALRKVAVTVKAEHVRRDENVIRLDDATDKAVQTCAKFCGLDESVHGLLANEIVARRPSRKGRVAMIVAMKRAGYTHVNARDPNWIVPVKG